MAKYHLTEEGPKICQATERSCIYGDTDHYEDQAEAYAAFAEKLEDEEGLFKEIRKDDFEEPVKHYKNGVLHRDNKPAVIMPNGEKLWYQNGKLHREDGPAVETPTGDKFYYKNGLLHNENGPAVIDSKGVIFAQNGKYHRTDGPAVVRLFGNAEFWVDGKELPSGEFYKKFPPEDDDKIDLLELENELEKYYYDR